MPEYCSVVHHSSGLSLARARAHYARGRAHRIFLFWRLFWRLVFVEVFFLRPQNERAEQEFNSRPAPTRASASQTNRDAVAKLLHCCTPSKPIPLQCNAVLSERRNAVNCFFGVSRNIRQAGQQFADAGLRVQLSARLRPANLGLGHPARIQAASEFVFALGFVVGGLVVQRVGITSRILVGFAHFLVQSGCLVRCIFSLGLVPLSRRSLPACRWRNSPSTAIGTGLSIRTSGTVGSLLQPRTTHHALRCQLRKPQAVGQLELFVTRNAQLSPAPSYSNPAPALSRSGPVCGVW